jgi:hypothetical protein
MAPLVKYAGERDTGEPEASSTRRRLERSAETVGGHAQTQGVVEDYGHMSKTHESCTLNTTGGEHAYRRLRMRVVVTCPATHSESPKPAIQRLATQLATLRGVSGGG